MNADFPTALRKVLASHDRLDAAAEMAVRRLAADWLCLLLTRQELFAAIDGGDADTISDELADMGLLFGAFVREAWESFGWAVSPLAYQPLFDRLVSDDDLVEDVMFDAEYLLGVREPQPDPTPSITYRTVTT